MPPADAYQLVLGAVIPRPIGWVSTISADGRPNLAPFSFFNLVGSNPPTLMIAPGARAGAEKDTLANVREVPELVHHVVDEAHAEVMNASSADVPADVDEFERAGIERVAADIVRPWRIKDAAVAMEARVTQIVPVQDTGYHLILAQVARVHVRDDLLGPDGRIDPERLKPIARLGGEGYATLGRVFRMARPRV